MLDFIHLWDGSKVIKESVEGHQYKKTPTSCLILHNINIYSLILSSNILKNCWKTKFSLSFSLLQKGGPNKTSSIQSRFLWPGAKRNEKVHRYTNIFLLEKSHVMPNQISPWKRLWWPSSTEFFKDLREV